jgi:septum formation protein
MTSPRVILGSTSPRRTLLLDQAGIPHRIIRPTFDDAGLTQGQVSLAAYVASLAALKAWSVVRAVNLDTDLRASARGSMLYVIGADTLAEMDGQLISKPASRADAESMLQSMLGRAHSVLSGLCIAQVDPIDGRVVHRLITFDRALVHMGQLPAQILTEYLDSNHWQGKAGGYNLADRLQAGWPIRFEGSAATVMGLPIEKLRQHLLALDPTLLDPTLVKAHLREQHQHELDLLGGGLV